MSAAQKLFLSDMMRTRIGRRQCPRIIYQTKKQWLIVI